MDDAMKLQVAAERAKAHQQGELTPPDVRFFYEFAELVIRASLGYEGRKEKKNLILYFLRQAIGEVDLLLVYKAGLEEQAIYGSDENSEEELAIKTAISYGLEYLNAFVEAYNPDLIPQFRNLERTIKKQ